MNKNVVCNGLKFGFLPFLTDLYSSDKIEYSTKTEQSAKLGETKSETGWDRVKRMFQMDEFGNVTAEGNSILQTACMSLFIGAIYGGTIQGKAAYEKFMRNNEATTFTTHLEAKKKLQDAVVLGFGKGAFRWGWRLAFFSCTYVGLSTIMQVYRGKYGIVEYVAAGATTGFIYKFNSGPRGWIVGSGLGSALGLVCGGATIGLLKLSGMSMEEARYWQYKWKENRSDYLRKGMANYLEEEDFPVIKMHNDEVGEAGRSLDNLDKNSDKKLYSSSDSSSNSNKVNK